MANERYPLRQIILDDLVTHNKVAILLLIAVIITAVGTVWITHHTRLLTIQENKLIQANRKLEADYIRLQSEEILSSEYSKIESFSHKAGLHRVKKEQEVILVK